MSQQVSCESITFVEGCSPLGTFANAFRVLNEQEPECLLDFILYSAQENKAQIVARVRVRRDFLNAIQDRLREYLYQIQPPQEKVVVQPDGLVSLDGQVLVFGGNDEEN